MFFQVLGHFMLDRRLQQLPGSFREQLFQVALGFIFGSLFERNHFSFHFRCILSFGASSESAVFFLVTERMRLSLSCHPQLSVIAPKLFDWPFFVLLFGFGTVLGPDSRVFSDAQGSICPPSVNARESSPSATALSFKSFVRAYLKVGKLSWSFKSNVISATKSPDRPLSYLTLRSHKIRFSASLLNISRLEEESAVRRWL